MSSLRKTLKPIDVILNLGFSNVEPNRFQKENAGARRSREHSRLDAGFLAHHHLLSALCGSLGYLACCHNSLLHCVCVCVNL